MLCPNCGKEINAIRDATPVCPECGVNIDWPMPVINDSNVSSPDRIVPGFIYAEFWQRSVAFLMDVVIWMLAAALYAIVAVALRRHVNHALLTSILVVFVLGGQWLYFSLFESSTWQATLGKRVMKIRVFSVAGKRISFGRASGRHFARFLSGWTIIGYLMAIFTKKNQALHDMIAGTVVIGNSKT
jgi:uncharacterized RDD family membrane protein YckC